MARPRLCSIPDCGKPHIARGWCNVHWLRWWKHGDPLGGGTLYGEPARYYQEVVLKHDNDQCLCWPFSRSSSGYGQIVRNGRRRIVSRLVCEHVNGPPPTPDHEAAHSCGKGKQGCVSPHHLRWATAKENTADKLIHGTTARGERNYNAKLTLDQVRQIRALRGSLRQKEIAKQFNVSRTLIAHIYAGNRWAHSE